MACERFAVQHGPLSVEALTRAVEADARPRGEGCGAVASFVGVVRGTHQGRPVRHLEYEAFEPLAVKVFARIAEEVAEHWPDATLAIHHRIGRLNVGEASVVVVAATPHRAEAFEVCRYGIERVKQIAPVWKHEFLADGDAWIEGAAADPDDRDARNAALARASRAMA
jgi:molybdopterin synthase catalytic subunit